MDWSKVDLRYTISNTVVDWFKLYASLQNQRWTIDCNHRRVTLGTYSKEDTSYVCSLADEFRDWLCANHLEKYKNTDLEHDKGCIYIIEYKEEC